MALFSDHEDARAHEDFVDQLDAALDDGFTAGWDGQPLPGVFVTDPEPMLKSFRALTAEDAPEGGRCDCPPQARLVGRGMTCEGCGRLIGWLA